MAYPTRINQPRKRVVETMNINTFNGINISANSTQIDYTESPDMINMLSDDKGALDGRDGRKTLFASLGTGSINCLLNYDKSTGVEYVFAYDTKLYTIDDIDIEPLTYTEIYDGVADTRITGFNFSDNLYIQDGVKYLVYDGSTVEDVVGYIPNVTVVTPPAGGGVSLEEYNLIQPGFLQLFTGDGVSTEYVLAQQNLDATEVVIIVDTVTVTEGVGFTVDRVNGKIDFSSGSAPYGAPSDPQPSTNNVSITAYKTVAERDDLIRDCTINAVWGGTEGNRVFLSGDPSYPHRDYRSGLLDATYFPIDGVSPMGNPDKAIESYSFLYNRLIIIKQGYEIYARNYVDNGGDPFFTNERLSSAIGASGKYCTEQLNNFPTFVTRKGVFQVTSIDPFNERNVRLISEKINKNIEVNSLAVSGILELGGLDGYVSADFDNKYWLFHPTLDYSWVLDYDESSPTGGSWYRLDNFNASCVLEINNKLYWGRADKGTICRFKDFSTDGDLNSDNEEGTAVIIEKRWTSKLIKYGSTTNLKLIKSVFGTIKQGANISANLYTRSDRKQPWKYWTAFSSSVFAYSILRYSTFAYTASDFPTLYKKKVKQKKVGFYQIKLESTDISAALGLIDINFTYIVDREVR